MGLGIKIGDWDWTLAFGTVIADWVLRLGIGIELGWELVIGIRNWDCRLGLGIVIGD